MNDFRKRKFNSMAFDKHGREVFLADTSYALSLAQEKFPDIRFHFTSDSDQEAQEPFPRCGSTRSARTVPSARNTEKPLGRADGKTIREPIFSNGTGTARSRYIHIRQQPRLAAIAGASGQTAKFPSAEGTSCRKTGSVENPTAGTVNRGILDFRSVRTAPVPSARRHKVSPSDMAPTKGWPKDRGRSVSCRRARYRGDFHFPIKMLNFVGEPPHDMRTVEY